MSLLVSRRSVRCRNTASVTRPPTLGTVNSKSVSTKPRWHAIKNDPTHYLFESCEVPKYEHTAEMTEIKKYVPNQTPANLAFFNEVMERTSPCPTADNPNQRSTDYQTRITVLMHRSTILLETIESESPSNGAGTKTIQWLKALSNKYDVPITALLKPYGNNPIPTRKLLSWYESLGFKCYRSLWLTYMPNAD